MDTFNLLGFKVLVKAPIEWSDKQSESIINRMDWQDTIRLLVKQLLEEELKDHDDTVDELEVVVE